MAEKAAAIAPKSDQKVARGSRKDFVKDGSLQATAMTGADHLNCEGAFL